MFLPKPKIVIKPPRKKDFRLPDGSVPEPKQWIVDGLIKPDERWIHSYWGRFDRASISQCIFWAEKGKLIYVPRIYYTFELRHSVRTNGKPTPKTLKTWFINNQDFDGNPLRAFWKAVNSDLSAFGLNRTEASRIKERIAEHIPKVEGTD